MRLGRRLTIGISSVISLYACGDEATRNGSAFGGMEEEAPVVRSEPEDLRAPPPGWSVRELFRLGAQDGSDPRTNFGLVEGVEVDEEGRVYVLDGQHHTVRVFGREGNHVQDIGRRGEGPGELMDPNGLVMQPDGRLLVRDRNRYTVFNHDGTVADTYFRAGPGGGDPVVAEDGVIYQTAVFNVDFMNRTGDFVFLGFVPQDGAMVPVDTVRRPPEVVEYRWVEFGPQGEGGMWPVPWAARSHDHFDPRGGFWRGTTDVNRFVYHSGDGEVMRIVERSGPPADPVTAEDRTGAIEELRESFGDRIQIDRADLPERKPHWSHFFVDEQARLWVERYRPSDTDPLVPRLWEVYDSEGRYLGVLPLPMEATPRPKVRGDRLVGTVRDALDVQYVVVFELRGHE